MQCQRNSFDICQVSGMNGWQEVFRTQFNWFCNVYCNIQTVEAGFPRTLLFAWLLWKLPQILHRSHFKNILTKHQRKEVPTGWPPESCYWSRLVYTVKLCHISIALSLGGSFSFGAQASCVCTELGPTWSGRWATSTCAQLPPSSLSSGSACWPLCDGAAGLELFRRRAEWHRLFGPEPQQKPAPEEDFLAAAAGH